MCGDVWCNGMLGGVVCNVMCGGGMKCASGVMCCKYGWHHVRCSVQCGVVCVWCNMMYVWLVCVWFNVSCSVMYVWRWCEVWWWWCNGMCGGVECGGGVKCGGGGVMGCVVVCV